MHSLAKNKISIFLNSDLSILHSGMGKINLNILFIHNLINYQAVEAKNDQSSLSQEPSGILAVKE
jgi:hypothetical protein